MMLIFQNKSLSHNVKYAALPGSLILLHVTAACILVRRIGLSFMNQRNMKGSTVCVVVEKIEGPVCACTTISFLFFPEQHQPGMRQRVLLKAES